MFTFSYSFRPWDKERSLGQGSEILQYLQDTARAEGIDGHIRFAHRVTAANWNSELARWEVTAHRTDTDEDVEMTAGFIVSCTGYYRYDRGYDPEFEGRDDFQGEIIHPQFWPQDLDYSGKRIVVIGSGATAVTLIPNLTDRAAHVTMLQRSPTYMISLPRVNPITKLINRVVPKGKRGAVLRWQNALLSQGMYQFSRRRPAVVKRALLKGVARELPPDFDVARHFTPRYGPWDQRLCVVPEGDLFKAIREGSASVVTDTVVRFDNTGILLGSGEHLEADIIVTATGLDLIYLGGTELSIDGEPLDITSRLAYKGAMLEDTPNFASVVGYTNASWTLKAELTCDYVTRLINEARSRGANYVVPHNSDPTMQSAPLLDLSSGYIQRAIDRMPKQGNRFPWQVHQSYLSDFRALKRSPLDDGVMQFKSVTTRTTVGSNAS